MSKEVFEQIVGAHQFCVEYDENAYNFHYELLKEADEFAAAATLYPDERQELLAHSLHRYQQIINKATNILGLDTDFLMNKRVSFNFYTDIANLFGLGTQAYTTESMEPYIGISELSLQDINLLQLILMHELQHAQDFVFNNGLGMGIAERELRARLSICQSLSEVQKQFNKLYKNAFMDQAYWYVILHRSPKVEAKEKEMYFELLEKDAKRILEEDEGIVFSPLVLRVFSKELEREKVNLNAHTAYRIITKNGAVKCNEYEAKRVVIEDQEMSEIESAISEDIETISDEPLSLKLAKVTGQRLSADGKNVSLIKNKMVEWHTYKDEFKQLKKTASIVITRNAESFNSLNNVYDTSINVPKVMKIEEPPQVRKEFAATEEAAILEPALATSNTGDDEDNELAQLRNLDIPDVNVSYTSDFNDAEVYLPSKPVYQQKKPTQVEEEEHLAQDVMSNLSQFVNRNR